MSEGAQVPTVRGLVDAASLGLVLPSEQLCFDSRDRHRFDTGTHTLRDAPITLDRLAELRAAPLASLTNLTHPGEAALSHELGRLTRSAGSATVVDLTPAAAHSGRDPLALRRLSEKAGVHVIMSTGCSMHQVAVALATTSAETVEAAEAEVVEQLASALVEDLLNGVPAGDTSVRAGALCLETLPSSSSSTEAVLLRVMANAQQRTGAPLFCALLPPAAADADAAERLERAAAALQSLVSGGASPGHLVVTQAQHGLAHPAALRAWLQLGVHLCFDGIGMSWAVAGFGTPDSDPWALPPSDDELSRAIVALVVEGFGSQVVLSHGIASRLQLACGGGGGLTYLSHAFLPRARRWGLTPEAEERLTHANAARLLEWALPAKRAARAVKTWSCSACHRAFEEAVNSGDALPTDREYYEKLTYRYCSVSCLAAHRRSGFVQPFECAPPP